MIPCPLCKKTLYATDNPTIFSCERTRLYIAELEMTVDYIHAMVHIDESGKQVFMAIEVPPYAFEIYDYDLVKRTKLYKMVDTAQHRIIPSFQKRGSRVQRFSRQIILDLPGTIHCQWDDPAKILEKINTLLTFS